MHVCTYVSMCAAPHGRSTTVMQTRTRMTLPPRDTNPEPAALSLTCIAGSCTSAPPSLAQVIFSGSLYSFLPSPSFIGNSSTVIIFSKRGSRFRRQRDGHSDDHATQAPTISVRICNPTASRKQVTKESSA